MTARLIVHFFYQEEWRRRNFSAVHLYGLHSPGRHNKRFSADAS